MDGGGGPYELAVLAGDHASSASHQGDLHGLVGLYLASVPAESSRRAMRSSLTSVARALAETSGRTGSPVAEDIAWHLFTYEGAVAAKAVLSSRGHAAATVNRHLAAVRGVVRTAKHLEVMPASRADHICSVALRDLRSDHTPDARPGRVVTPAELDSVFDSFVWRTDPRSRWDVAMLAVLARTGLRRSELVALAMSDWSPEVGELIVAGKGNVRRKAWLSGWAADALAEWLVCRGGEPGPIFVSVRRGDQVDVAAGAISTQTVWDRLRVMAHTAGVELFRPHDLRRTLATTLLDAGHDVLVVGRLLGHARPEATAIYDRRGERAAAAAAADMPVYLDRLATAG